MKVSYAWMMLSTQGHDWNVIAIGGQNSQYATFCILNRLDVTSMTILIQYVPEVPQNGGCKFLYGGSSTQTHT